MKNKLRNIKFIFFILLFNSIIFEYIFIKNKIIRVCLCVIGKNENLYAKEFVNHYKKLGYNHIFIYDNNDNKNEKFIDILQKEIKEGFVSIIDYIGYKGKNNSSQREAFYDCYKKNRIHYHWLSFFDFDEYLEIKPKNKTIQQFLNNDLYKKCQNIKINWLTFSSEKEKIYYENNSLQLRFNKPIFNHISNKHIKSTVRGHIKDNYWSQWATPHSSLYNFISCSSSGKQVDNKTPYIEPPDYEYAAIKHFSIKSFEEYCYKLKRGWPDSTNTNLYINSLINSSRNNIEKIKIIKKIFN